MVWVYQLKYLGWGGKQPPWLLIGCAPQHDAVDKAEMVFGLGKACDAAIDDDAHSRQRGLEPIYPVVVERREVTILLRRQSIEPGLAGVDDQRIRAGGDDAARQRIQRDFRILVVDADPAFDGHRNADRALHGVDTGGDQCRLRHQAGAKPAILHAIRWTADIEVDFVITEILANFRTRREVSRLGAAQLKRDAMFAYIKTQHPASFA